MGEENKHHLYYYYLTYGLQFSILCTQQNIQN